MSVLLCLALYFVIWWMTLFAILPIGVKSQHEAGDVVPGSEGAAPRLQARFHAQEAVSEIRRGAAQLLTGKLSPISPRAR